MKPLFLQCMQYFISWARFSLLLITNYSLLITNSYPQSDSALLEKIKNIDVSLNSIQYDEENLYSPDVSFQSFYDELSPYGEWIMVTKEEIDSVLKKGEGQGYSSPFADENTLFIWHPSVDNPGWKPYLNGKWEYTAQGWMWVSDYTWGWAPYHYGRWMQFKEYGWVWMPGYVWSPSWVMWRVSGTHVGWSPLSPSARWNSEYGITAENYKYNPGDDDWVFVQKSAFDEKFNDANIAPISENGRLIAGSQKILDIKAEDNRLVNTGPDVKQIERSTGRTIRQKNILPLNQRTKSIIGENEIKVYREKFSKVKVDALTGKRHKIDRPKKYKRSPKVRRQIKRRHRRHR